MKNWKAKADTKLKDCPTRAKDIDSDFAKKELKNIRKEIASIQEKLYAHNKYAVLICLQGMDTAGKDSLIREVFKDFNARGVSVYSFKTPSVKELQHDYLWRHYIALPERGKFAVFNRTHYENVLISKVNPEIIQNENIPSLQLDKKIPKDFWKDRYESINNFEKHISKNGTIIFKFFLHLSKDEQRARLLRRLDKEKHNWKFSPGDLKERKKWKLYEAAYQDIIRNCSTDYAPWYIIPADDKKVSRYLVAKTILDVLSTYTDIKYPSLDEAIQKDLKYYKKELEEDN